MTLNHDVKLKKGLSHCIFILCAYCPWQQKFYSSKTISKPVTSGPKTFDVNLRMILAFREIGKGYSSIKKLLQQIPIQDSQLKKVNA